MMEEVHIFALGLLLCHVSFGMSSLRRGRSPRPTRNDVSAARPPARRLVRRSFNVSGSLGVVGCWSVVKA